MGVGWGRGGVGGWMFDEGRINKWMLGRGRVGGWMLVRKGGFWFHILARRAAHVKGCKTCKRISLPSHTPPFKPIHQLTFAPPSSINLFLHLKNHSFINSSTHYPVSFTHSQTPKCIYLSTHPLFFPFLLSVLLLFENFQNFISQTY